MSLLKVSVLQWMICLLLVSIFTTSNAEIMAKGELEWISFLSQFAQD